MPGIVYVSPAVMEDKRDAMAVALNEALRIFMEDVKFDPKFEVTPEQRKLFRGTAYSDDEGALRKTVVARVATFDTSVAPTQEQVQETRRLLDLVTGALGPNHRDYQMVKKIDELLAGGARNRKAEPGVPAAAGSPQDAALAGEVSMTPSVAGLTLSSAPVVPEAERVLPKKSWVTAAQGMLRERESFRATAYPDPDLKSGRWSVAYGNQFHPGQKTPVKKGDTVSKDKADAYLADAMQYNVGKLSASLGKSWGGLTGGQKAALTSWAYNVGETNARGSTLVRRIKRGEDARRVIREELPRWNDKGRAAERRAAEVLLAESADYE